MSRWRHLDGPHVRPFAVLAACIILLAVVDGLRGFEHRELGLHPYVAQKALAQSKAFTRSRLVSWHDDLVEIEYQLKSAPVDVETLMMKLLARNYAPR